MSTPSSSWCVDCKWNIKRWPGPTIPDYCSGCTQRTGTNDEPSEFFRLSPGNGDERRCVVHGCFCIIKSVSEDYWDPDWFCPKCEAEEGSR